MRILCLQGPNLNLLGTRQPEIYGSETLEAIQARMDIVAAEVGAELEHFQSNHEGELIDRIHQTSATGCVINPAAYGHTSIAIRDALSATGLPYVEVHLSNVYAREPFRQTSLLAANALGVVIGLGPVGYELALRGLADRLRNR